MKFYLVVADMSLLYLMNGPMSNISQEDDCSLSVHQQQPFAQLRVRAKSGRYQKTFLGVRLEQMWHGRIDKAPASNLISQPRMSRSALLAFVTNELT